MTGDRRFCLNLFLRQEGLESDTLTERWRREIASIGRLRISESYPSVLVRSAG